MPSARTSKRASTKKTASSRRKSSARSRTRKKTSQTHNPALFWMIVGFTLVMWILYRSLFEFPVWFDETIGKALFFGVPVWLFVVIAQAREVIDPWVPQRFNVGSLRGLAYGGVIGFIGSITVLLTRQVTIQAAPLFSTGTFWYEFFFALMTGFWETVFFFAFTQTMIAILYPKWRLGRKIALTAMIFLLFHIPNAFLRFDVMTALYQIPLLLLFALGQALIFTRERNGYTLALTHAIWGMVLLVHG